MSNEAFDWLVLTAGIFLGIGVCALVAAVVESQWQRKRDREERLPPPEWRARVYRRWGVPE